MNMPAWFSKGRNALALITLAALASASTLPAIDCATVKKMFTQPGREYSTAPLWVWNDMLSEEQVRETMRDLAGQQVKQVFVHPRPGLMTPYLSNDWFRLWKVALKEAARLDMNLWIYDENSYPSGFAGGWVPEVMPEARGRGLVLREVKSAPKWAPDLVAVYRLGQAEDGACENVTAKVRAGEDLPEARYVVAAVQRAGNSPWHGNRCYVDLMYPGVTQKFLELTLEPYRREIGSEFGRRVPGVFTDEPNINPAGGLPWTEDLPRQFQKRWGEDLLEHLPGLTLRVGDWRKIRYQYFTVLNQLFIERWAKPYHDYCQRHGLQFTGHYWDHEWPNCKGVPDNMAMYAWHQRPAIDTLMNQYAEHTHAQFGNARMVKELSSVANQLGRQRTLCELYGAGGWDLRFEDMKRIGDWLEVLGVNTLDEHLSYVTLRGARKRDHPQSFSYHEPWWEAYHVNARYLTRVSAALSQGEQINHVLVLEPTTTAWMYQGEGGRLQSLAEGFCQLVMALEGAQVEYDLGSEDLISRHGQSTGEKFSIGRRSYETVVIPPLTENLNARTVELLERFLAGGGRVLCGGEPPARTDGVPSERGARLAQNASWKKVDSGSIPGLVSLSLQQDGLRIVRQPRDQGILFHHRRQIDDGELLFLVNTSLEAPSAGMMESRAAGIEEWDPASGEFKPYRFRSLKQGVRAEFQLPPSGSLLLCLTKKARPPAPNTTDKASAIPALGAPEIRRVAPNVLTLDYVTITAGGQTRSNIYFYQAGQFAFQKNGLARNPWDSAVQFRDELIRRKFAPGSGFEASYRFRIEGAVPRDLAIVIERPDLYAITCNGKPVRARKHDWWLDKAFGRIPIARNARVGENIVTLKASPFSLYHELEPAYVLGSFSLKPATNGFIIGADQPLRIVAPGGPPAHEINPDGTMWLSAGIGFTERQGKTADDRAPYIIFDLGQPVDLEAIQIWNYNENHVRDLTSRGAKSLRLSAAVGENLPYSIDLGAIQLSRAPGRKAPPEMFPAKARGVRFVRFDVLANYNGVSYPANADSAPDNAFVGLAEVQFIADGGQAVTGVTIAKVSSELPSHRRVARQLVDGSGLTDARVGWNRQGHPFYSAGVAYRQRFQVEKSEPRYVVSLPSWYGSVARVSVNGKLAGYITAPPWECDVTPQIKSGENTVEVVVIGTLKNTLGPHHGQPATGSAWPGMFQHGPPSGPPPGAEYSTIGYGLFEPFQLKQITAQQVIQTMDVQVGQRR